MSAGKSGPNPEPRKATTVRENRADKRPLRLGGDINCISAAKYPMKLTVIAFAINVATRKTVKLDDTIPYTTIGVVIKSA
jgi:hypothetical protein